MKCLRVFSILLGVLKVFGLFPYRIRVGKCSSVLHWPLLVYSLLLFGSVLSIHIYTAIKYPFLGLSQEFDIDMIVYVIQMMSILVVVSFSAVHSVIFGKELARIFTLVVDVASKEIHGGNIDWSSLCYLPVLLVAVGYILVHGWSPDLPFMIQIQSFVYTLYCAPSIFFKPLLFHATLRLLDQVLTSSFTNLFNITEGIKLNEEAPCPITGSKKITSHDHETSSSLSTEDPQLTCTEGRSPGFIISVSSASSPCSSVVTALHSARRCLCTIDQLVEDLTCHLGPVICVQLLSELAMVVTFLVGVNQPTMTLTVIYLLCVVTSFVRTVILLNAPEVLRSRRRGILRQLRCLSVTVISSSVKAQLMDLMEEMRVNEPQFSVLGAFNLGRHCILSMLSAILTYFIIIIQFRLQSISTLSTPAFTPDYTNITSAI